MKPQTTKRALIVRYRQGIPLFITPDLLEKTREVLAKIQDGTDLNSLIAPINDGNGWGVHPDSTWPQLIKELLREFGEPSRAQEDRQKAALRILDRATGCTSPEEIWNAAKSEILANVDVLSGWAYSHARLWHERDPVVRSDGRYYVISNGQPCEIIGKRTETEERWDYIADDATRSYGSIKALIKLVALLNICLEFRGHPEQFPEKLLLVLPENGGTGYLHWQWHLEWPYRLKPLYWRPKNNLCDPEGLTSDLLAQFSEQEKMSDKDLDPFRWQGTRADFEREFANFQGQLEFALDTPLIFDDVEEVWFKFRGTTIRWVNQTENMHTILIVPVSDRNNDVKEYELAMRFLSQLSFDRDLPISVITSVGSARHYAPMLRQPKRSGGTICSPEYVLRNPAQPAKRSDLAYAFYKEGVGSPSVYYAFLNFYKIVQLAFNEDEEKIIDWINANLSKIRYPGAAERVAEIKQKEPDVVGYLFRSGRCAIAHVNRKPVADPDAAEDQFRLSKDLRVVKGLARLAIECGLFQ